MHVTRVIREERAVSPVIGVVLMVGITVTLAALIAAFVFGTSVATSTPDAEFRYEADPGSNDVWGDNGDRFLIHHDGGEDVDLSHVTVEYDHTPVSTITGIDSNAPSGDTWKPGETWKLEDDGGGNFQSGKQVLVLWESGGSSQILADGDLP